jgi:transmembrane sensor
MKTPPTHDENILPARATLIDEAAEWLVRLDDPTPEDPYHDLETLNRAFYDWLLESKAHLRAFMELVEVRHRVSCADPTAFTAPFTAPRALTAVPQATVTPLPIADDTTQPIARRRVFNRTGVAVIASLAAACVGGILYFHVTGTQTYSTGFGEQHPYSLKDGSVIRLNTDSQVEVTFSWRARTIRLLRGEASFSVAHDVWWPFTVKSSAAIVRALGTEFDVRQESESVRVAVVKGTVQVAALTPAGDTPSKAHETTSRNEKLATTASPMTLSAGQMAQISPGSVTKLPGNVDEALSWMQKRLIFHETPLADVVKEFNRYNRVQLRVEGAVAQEFPVTGIFDLDGYQDILLIARKTRTLRVSPEGKDWVIRSRD